VRPGNRVALNCEGLVGDRCLVQPQTTTQLNVVCSRLYGSELLWMISFKVSAKDARSTGASNSAPSFLELLMAVPSLCADMTCAG
jgi:hypothetical protein